MTSGHVNRSNYPNIWRISTK